MKNKELENKVSNQLNQVADQIRQAAENLDQLAGHSDDLNTGEVRHTVGTEIRMLKSAIAQLDHLDFVLFGEEQGVRS